MAQQKVHGGSRPKQSYGSNNGNRYGARSGSGTSSNYRNSSRPNYHNSSHHQQPSSSEYDYDYLDYGSGYVGDYRYSTYTPTAHDQQLGQQYYALERYSAAPATAAAAPAPPRVYSSYSPAPNPLPSHPPVSYPAPSAPHHPPLSTEAPATVAIPEANNNTADAPAMLTAQDQRRNPYPAPQAYHPSYGQRGQQPNDQFSRNTSLPLSSQPMEFYPAPKPPVLSGMLQQHSVTVTPHSFYPQAALGYAPHWSPSQPEMYPSYHYPTNATGGMYPSMHGYPPQPPPPPQHQYQQSDGNGGGGYGKPYTPPYY
jgi:hypothetical protein